MATEETKTPVQRVEPGNVIAGRYEIVRRLGEGGMCVVYKARQLDFDRMVAIKMLRPAVGGRNDLKRMQREAVAITSLDHPNIVKVFSFDCMENGSPYLAMEYLEGTNLADVLRERGPLSKEETLQIMLPVLDALEHAHQQGIVHRDLKPSNIMITGSGLTPKIVDFGIAKLMPDAGKDIQKLTQTDGLVGTVAYMSPEQCVGKTVDARTDIYALGCILFEALTGEPPFDGTTPFALMHKHANETVTPAHQLNDEFGAVVMRCLEKDPEDRPQSAAELKEQLLRPPRQVRSENSKQAARRLPYMAAMGVAAVAVSIVALAAWSMRPSTITPAAPIAETFRMNPAQQFNKFENDCNEIEQQLELLDKSKNYARVLETCRRQEDLLMQRFQALLPDDKYHPDRARQWQARMLSHRLMAQFYLKDYGAALNSARDAISAYEAMKDRGDFDSFMLSNDLSVAAILLIKKGELSEARTLGKSADLVGAKSDSLRDRLCGVISARGDAWFDRRMYEDALVDFSRAILVNPKESIPYEHRARCYSRLGQTKNAKADRETYERLERSAHK